MRIRPIDPDRPGDVERYRTVRLRALRTDPDAFGSTYERERAFDDDTLRSRLRGFQGRPGAVFVAETAASAEPVAMIGVGHSAAPASDATIWGMWVAPDHRGAGVSDALMTAAEDWAVRSGCRTVTLFVMGANRRAAAFYARRGYVTHDPTVDGVDPPDGCVDERCLRLDDPLGRIDVDASRVAYGDSVDRYLATVGTELSDRTETTLDRAILDVFVGDLLAAGRTRAVDVGCGPGRIAAVLAEAGLDACGIDLAPAMVDAARRAHPGIRFEIGELTALPLADASIDGAVYWYSTIATPTSGLAAVWTESTRVLSPGGRVLVAFASGDGEIDVRASAYGTEATLLLHRHRLDDVVDSMLRAGLTVDARLERGPVLDHETTSQAIVVATLPAHDGAG